MRLLERVVIALQGFVRLLERVVVTLQGLKRLLEPLVVLLEALVGKLKGLVLALGRFAVQGQRSGPTNVPISYLFSTNALKLANEASHCAVASLWSFNSSFAAASSSFHSFHSFAILAALSARISALYTTTVSKDAEQVIQMNRL